MAIWHEYLISIANNLFIWCRWTCTHRTRRLGLRSPDTPGLSKIKEQKIKSYLAHFKSGLTGSIRRHRRVSICHTTWRPLLRLSPSTAPPFSLGSHSSPPRFCAPPTLPSPPPLPPPEQAAFRRELVPPPRCLLYPTNKLEFTGESIPLW